MHGLDRNGIRDVVVSRSPGQQASEADGVQHPQINANSIPAANGYDSVANTTKNIYTNSTGNTQFLTYASGATNRRGHKNVQFEFRVEDGDGNLITNFFTSPGIPAPIDTPIRVDDGWKVELLASHYAPWSVLFSAQVTIYDEVSL